MLRLSYFLGNYYPRGRSQRFVDDLGQALVRRGGKVLKCAEVTEILVSREQVRGVRIRTVSKRPAEEFEFCAPVVVSNADAMHTYRDLLGEGHCGREVIESMETMAPTYPCFLMHIGLRGMSPERLAGVEGYHWSSFDPVDAIRDVFKIFIPTHFDPTVAPPGCQILIVQKLSAVRLEDVKDWRAHKNQIEGVIMQRLREILPDIDRHIVVQSSATAMTSYRFTRNWQGAMLGWEMSPDQLGPGRLAAVTPVRNLHLVGHWTQPGGGITPVIISAQRAAQAIVNGTRPQVPTAQFSAFGSAGNTSLYGVVSK